MKFISYSNTNFHKTVYYKRLPLLEKRSFDILSKVFHFKVNRYVLDHLINWGNVPNDPIYQLVFPRKEMLPSNTYELLNILIDGGCTEIELAQLIHDIKKQLHPRAHHAPTSLPRINGKILKGMYQGTDSFISLFPNPMMKTCHTYCSYCFRWIMFNNKNAQDNSTYDDPEYPVAYLHQHPEIREVLFTGADPLVLKAETLQKFIDPILEFDQIETIHISSKSFAWWPFRFTDDRDAEELLTLFKYIKSKGKRMNLIAHFTHPKELEPPVVKQAIERIRSTGTTIQCQGPLVRGINDDADILSTMWSQQAVLDMIPAYLFVEADHNPATCFSLPFAKSLSLFQAAQQKTDVKTVKGPIFLTDPHRVLIDGTIRRNGQKYFVFKSTQCPPKMNTAGMTKLIPYDEEIKDAGNLFDLFNEEELQQV